MAKNKLSYAEAYTDFLKYCSEKEGIKLEELVFTFKNNGIEREFKVMYDTNAQVSNAEFYKRIKG